MDKILFTLFLMGLAYNSYPKPIIVAVVDSGFGFNKESLKEKHLCKYGHKDFTDDKDFTDYFKTIDSVPVDKIGHGTIDVGLIDKFAKGNYCIVIIKALSSVKINPIDFSRKAFKYINSLKPDIVNYSAGGGGFDLEEYTEVKKYLDNGGILVAAAGNDGQSLDNKENAYYPAMYDKRIKIVGNLDNDGKRQVVSNYGKIVKYWEFGTNVKAFGLTAIGTSQSTAILSGKLVNKIKRKNGTQSTKAKKDR